MVCFEVLPKIYHQLVNVINLVLFGGMLSDFERFQQAVSSICLVNNAGEKDVLGLSLGDVAFIRPISTQIEVDKILKKHKGV